MLSKELENTLNDAFRDARSKRHEFMTVEHLLLALTGNDAAVRVLGACGANLERLKVDLEEFIDATTPRLSDQNDAQETQPTLGFQRVLQRAVFHVQSSGREEVTGANVMVAIFNEKESQAVYFLNQQEIHRMDVVNYISHGISKVSDPGSQDKSSEEDHEQSLDAESEAASNDALEGYATNLNRLAMEGKIDPLIGRDEEVSRLVQILSRRRKNNPLLVGDSGVKKNGDCRRPGEAYRGW